MASPHDKYPTAESLNEAIGAYIADCVANKKKLTTAGLTAWLGYANKCSLRDLAIRDEEYNLALGRFKLFLEDQSVQGLLTPGQPTTGHIFNLKNNMGWGNDEHWVDRQEVESKGTVINVIRAIDREDEPSE